MIQGMWCLVSAHCLLHRWWLLAVSLLSGLGRGGSIGLLLPSSWPHHLLIPLHWGSGHSTYAFCDAHWDRSNLCWLSFYMGSWSYFSRDSDACRSGTPQEEWVCWYGGDRLNALYKFPWEITFHCPHERRRILNHMAWAFMLLLHYFLGRLEVNNALACWWNLTFKMRLWVSSSPGATGAVWIPPSAWSNEGRTPFCCGCRVSSSLPCLELCALNVFYFSLWWNTYNILSF